MAIRINYDGSNNILFFTALITPLTKEGIALDALRVVFQNLYETTERLENKLLNIGKGLVDLGSTFGESHVAYSSLLCDIWVIIDGTRRLQLILSHISNIPVTLNEELNQIFNKIKHVRDSFHHIDERIDLHFDKIGGSVFGDVSWRYRERIGVPEVLHCLITGVSKVSRNVELQPVLEQHIHFDVTGIYDLELHYIKREYKSTHHSKVIVNIDEVVTSINKLIDYFEDRYSCFIETSDNVVKAEGPEPDVYFNKAMTCDPPRIYRFKATEKGFKRISQSRMPPSDTLN